jgi:hypothetical protein
MKKYNTDYEKLSAYIDGELPLSDKNELEERLSFSADLRKKLEELRKIKELTSASFRKLPESPYLDTRIMANIKSAETPLVKRRWIPVLGLVVITAALMLVLKFNPRILNRLVEEQTTNLAAFYKENLKPLLYASNLSNEDIFNFAFYKELPLDNNNEQYLTIGQDEEGKEFFEIRKSSYNTEENNYERFVTALSLNEAQKRDVDSILQHYAAELQAQILVSDRNTVAINPNLWNYNTAIAADLVKFASRVNEPELRKILPPSGQYFNPADMDRMIVEVKGNKENNYIFLTPDTIFTSWVDVDTDEMRRELSRARTEISRANREITRSFSEQQREMSKAFTGQQKDMNRAISEQQKELQKTFAAIRLDSLSSRDKKYKKEKFTVSAGSNNFRVVMPEFRIPEISVPNMDSISAGMDKALKSVHFYTTNSPKNPTKLSKRYNFQYGYKDSLTQMFLPEIPGMDSLMKGNFNYYYNNNKYIDSVLSLYIPEFKFRQDSLTNYFKLYRDSARYLYESDLQEQLKEMESEMRRFREEMQNLRRELKGGESRGGENPAIIKKPVEI